MIIVIQNGNGFVNLDNVSRVFIEDYDKKIIYASLIGMIAPVQLGIYKTEKKAKEILDQIVDSYLDCNVVDYVSNSVYCMPGEEE